MMPHLCSGSKMFVGDSEGRFRGEVASIVGLDRNTGIGEGSVDVVGDEVCVF